MTTYANRQGYTDVEPYEVIKHISDKTLEVRLMDAILDESWKPEFTPGGFCGHCTNNGTQRWTISKNERNPVIRIRKQKSGAWKDQYGWQYQLSDVPRKFYDYNF